MLIISPGFSLLWFMDPNAFLPPDLHAGLLYILLVTLALSYVLHNVQEPVPMNWPGTQGY